MPDAFQIETRTITALDGYPLSALSVVPPRPRACVLISSGTGFPKEFYQRFAQAGARRGYACLLYDYRGIAGSAPERMRGFKADIIDWARRDMPAALNAAAGLVPGKPLFTAGHSVGGHLIGFCANSNRARAHAFINVGSGYWGHHQPHYKPQALFFWLVYGPACLAALGHIPPGGLWGGTALPRGVFTQWRRWCFRKHYYGSELDDLLPHWFDRVKEPIRSWGVSDDAIATRRAAQDILKLYSAAPREEIWLEPGELGQAFVGHQGLFTRKGEAFWPMPFDWFDSMIATSTAARP